MRHPREIVEAIQRDRGFDPAGISADLQRRCNRNLRDLGNALKLLSDQLYNSDGHFLLELLQNADDNAYPVGAEPTIVIEATSASLVFRNNEVGFAEPNVEAICSIGESTKHAQKSETIGEKGIGFKAVFKVSDRPEVHSGGFHFCFDRARCGDLGLVTPIWLDSPSGAPPVSGTTIVLPYKKANPPSSDLLTQLRPELLLFLRRLRRIRVVDAPRGVETVFVRKDQGPFVEIVRTHTLGGKTASTTFNFFRHSKTVVVRDLADELRPEVQQTEVVVALPLGEDRTIDGTTPRHLFAFLPIRESGLRFVAHADFILNTSREDVIRERPWNIRLRDELGTALTESILAIQAHGSVGRSALRVLSKPSAITDAFLRPVLERAIGMLKTARCIPVKDNEWSTPSLALRPDKDKLSELVPTEESSRLLGKSFLDDSVTLISDTLDLLGVAKFQFSDLLRACGQTDWLGTRTAAWFADLYQRLAPLSEQEDIGKQLRGAPVIRLGDGSMIAASEGSVFRSLSPKSIYGFECLFRVLDPSILDAARASSCVKEVDSLLSQLGVYDAEPAAVFDQHIIPMHLGDEWKTAKDEVLFGHARYTRDHLDTYVKSKADTSEKALADVRSTLWFFSARVEGDSKYVSHHAADLYLGDAYGDPHRLQWLLSETINDDIVSSAYVSGRNAEERSSDTEAWARFFRRLGIATLPKVHLSNTMPGHVQPPPPQRGATSLTVTDWLPSVELAALFKAQDAERKESLLGLLDRFWGTHWSKYAACQVVRGSQRAPGVSSFVLALRGISIQDSRGEWAPLADFYQPTENNKAVFGHGVRYLRESLESHDFMSAVGIVAEPTVEQVLTRLIKLSRGATGDKKSVTKLYSFLAQHWEGHESLIAEHFRDHHLICAEFGESTVWVGCGDCCWQVPARLREAAPIYGVSGIWSRLEEFFRERVGLRESMTRAEWVATLLKLSDVELEPTEAGDLTRQVYRELESILRSDEIAENENSLEWLSPLIEGNAVWTTRSEWWRNAGDVFADDDPSLSELFKDSQNIAFVDIPPSELPRFSRLLSALSIRRISEADREPSGIGVRCEAVTLTDRLRSRWIPIVRLLYFLHHDRYELDIVKDRLSVLREIKVSAWKPLLLDVKLHEEQRQRRFDCKLRSDEGGIELLVDAEEQENWDAIGQEIGRWLGLDDAASFRLGGVLAVKDETALEKRLKSLRVHELPSAEIEFLSGTAPVVTKDETRTVLDSGADDDLDDDVNYTEANVSKSPKVLSDGDGGARGGHIPEASGGPAHSDGATTGAPRPDAAPMEVEGLTTSPEGTSCALAGSQGSGTAPPTTPDRGKLGQRKPQRSAGRLISYVEPHEGSERDSPMADDAQPGRDRVGRAAVEYVVLKEQEEQRRPEVRDHLNPGYDIESFKVSGESDRYIEVKGLQDVWGERGVTMSSTQFAFAKEHRDRSWLYVVEFAEDPARRKLWRIRDPASKVSKFGFDHGWREAAELAAPTGPPGQALIANAKWRCDDGAVGTITSVKRSPSFVSITVVKPDGTSLNRSGPEELLRRNIVET